MKDTKNNWFWPVKEKVLFVLQGDEKGASKETLKRMEVFNTQVDLINAGMKRINGRLLIDKTYKVSTVIIGKLKNSDRIWTDGAIEYLSKDNYIFRVFMNFDKEEGIFKFTTCDYQFDIYKAAEVCHDNAVLMDIEQQEDGIVYEEGIYIGEFFSDKEVQDISEGDREKFLAIFDKMEKDLLKITKEAEKYFKELFADESKEIQDIIQVTACEFADASLKRQQGLCIEYTLSSEDFFQGVYTKHQLRVLENGKIDGVGIHI
ncbi:hypothetical protein [Clostridium sp. JS66]|uniref:hypothetical protein n=1 Tax=Clostridium sp. JS66 TaxID=3064705 RepID=UPI00298E24E2|nr:hypothetical protein [Clostridium sp. JS66]WPC39857.1 hypothetical protein Q6H37_18290 [Clostridium sp. JS66]